MESTYHVQTFLCYVALQPARERKGEREKKFHFSLFLSLSPNEHHYRQKGERETEWLTVWYCTVQCAGLSLFPLFSPLHFQRRTVRVVGPP